MNNNIIEPNNKLRADTAVVAGHINFQLTYKGNLFSC